jgi:hypothetical protein
MITYEDIFRAIATEFETQLALKIAEINTASTDFDIAAIDTEAFVYGSLNEQVVNHQQFVLAYIESVSNQIVGNAAARTLSIEFDLAIARRSDNRDYFRILRYWEALTRAGQALFDKVLIGFDKPELDILTPISVTLFDGSDEINVVGVKISVTVYN